MTDQLDDLFRDLRAETLTTVRPPGTAAARRTLRRRRTTRTVGTAACLVAAGAGGLGAHLLGPSAPGRMPTDVGDRPLRAAAAVGPVALARFSGQGAAQTGTIARGRVVAGLYTLRLSCVGRGEVTLSIQVNGAEFGNAAASCGDGAVATQSFTMPDPVTVTAELRTDDGADGRAGYAYTMVLADRDRAALSGAVAAAMPANRLGTVVEEWRGPVVKPTTRVTALAAGRYHLLYACAGIGRISVVFRKPDVRMTPETPCDGTGDPRSYTFEMAEAGRFELGIVPDADADRQSAYELRLERL